MLISLPTGLRDALSLEYWQLRFQEENYFKLEESGGFSISLSFDLETSPSHIPK